MNNYFVCVNMFIIDDCICYIVHHCRNILSKKIVLV